jgi:hypothetical protein
LAAEFNFFKKFIIKSLVSSRPPLNPEQQSCMQTSLTSDEDPSSSTLTIRLVKSFEFRTIKNIVLHNINLFTATSTTLAAAIYALLDSDGGLRPYKLNKEKYDTCLAERFLIG